MGWYAKSIVLILAISIVNVIYNLDKGELVKPPPATWWGPGDPNKVDDKITPFTVNVSKELLSDLRTRLKSARISTPPLQGIQQQYGLNTNLLKNIVDYWLTKYDWKEREKFLNQYPQYTIPIQGLKIHYIHVKPKNVPHNVKILPLLLLHGWPGSVREFYEVIPLLTKVKRDTDFVFEVIVPSLPGYGFSEGAVKPGLGVPQMAVVFHNLMQTLKFDKYYVQGGDWGSLIASAMAHFYPNSIKGIHLNICFSLGYKSQFKLWMGSLWPSLIVDKKYKHKVYPLKDQLGEIWKQFGYLHLQATKPDTVGVGLNDSPVGLAAYILEKFIVWSNPNWENLEDGGLTKKFTYEKLLDNIMIYWVSNSITTSVRLYAESINAKQNVFFDWQPVSVPTACPIFSNELLYQPPTVFKDKYLNVVQINEYDGGHFAAFEVPESLAKDVWLAVATFKNLIH